MQIIPSGCASPGVMLLIAALAPYSFWTRNEMIGSSNEEMLAVMRNQVPAARIAEINAAHAAALNRLAGMPVEGRPS
jgi:hypothetical protein